MDLNTRCPYCETVFAASLEQLQLRKGFIRCVQCAHIFDGYEHVVAADAAVSARVASTATHTPVRPSAASATHPHDRKRDDSRLSHLPLRAIEPRSPAGPGRYSGEPQVSVEPSIPSLVRGRREFTISDPDSVPAAAEPFLRVPESSDNGDGISGVTPGAHGRRTDADPFPVLSERHMAPATTMAEHVIGDADDAVDDAPHSMSAEAFGVGVPGARSPLQDHHDTWDAGKPPRSAWRWLATVVWALLIILATLVLAVQLAYVFRVQIAENVPALRPALERLCEPLQCTVPWSRQIDMIVIIQSALHQEVAGDDSDDDGDAVGTAILQFTLRNTYDRAQEWPKLVLELKDFAGATVARKHLSKEVYLPADVQDLPFPAGSERAVTLPLSLHGINVNGYQLTQFFP